MRKLIKELWNYKLALVLLIVSVIGNAVGSLVLPAYLATIINEAIPNSDVGLIIKIGGLMFIVVIISTIANIATGFFAARISIGACRDIRSQVFKKIQYFSNVEFDRFSPSSLITRTNNDIIQVQNFLNMVLRISLLAPFMCIGGIFMALEKSTTMSMILLISMPIMFVVVWLIAQVATPLGTAMQEKIDAINLVTREKLTGIRVARAFGTEEYETQRFYQVNNNFMDSSMKMNRVMGLLTPVLSIVLFGTMVALLAYGGYNIIQTAGGIPIGDIVAVVQYVMQIMMSVMLLAMVFVMYPRAAVSAKRINEVLDTKYSINDGSDDNPSDTHGYLEFKNVGFTFPNAQHPALIDISFVSKPGETTAIIGSTGCGKSTLVNLIPRFYDVSSGQILINGRSIKDYSLHDLRNRIGFVPQRAFLFKGTIASNIQFGDENADQKRIEETVKIAQSYDFIVDKEDSFLSGIAQGGTNVSGGQRQRLAIARAIVRKPEIYVFDDSFSALDFKTDSNLRAALADQTKQATVIIVAQRISTIKNADRILVLEQGKCVGQGTHSELLKSCTVYQEIVYSQLSKEEV